jgi:RNA polymerase sigma factor (sigma-70 family)
LVTMELPSPDLVQQAVDGDKDALEALVRQIQDPTYALAIRMLWHPADAEDATQEILVKIVTHLASFRRESSFSTWCYRIATNHLLTTRKRRAERREVTFEKFEEDIQCGLAYSSSEVTSEAEHGLLVEELMIGCTQGMLLCLDRDLRVTYILGEILEVNSRNASDILDITPAAFRKRLSRARSLLRDFVRTHCGLAEPSNPCKCSQQLPYSIKTGLVNPQKLLFAGHQRRDPRGGSVAAVLNEVNEVKRFAALFRGPDYTAPDTFVESVQRALEPQHSEPLQSEKCCKA